MSNTILIDAKHKEEIRIATIDGQGRLCHYNAEITTKKPLKGNIYLGRVARIEPALQAAFIHYASDSKNGFLSSSASSEETQQKNQNLVQKNQTILVQVLKEERAHKGAALTTAISLAGRYCVLFPNAPTPGFGVSRKITASTERKRLKEILQSLPIPEGMSLITRTAATDCNRPELYRDLKYLVRTWYTIKKQAQKSKAPCLIYEGSDVLQKTIRDLYEKDTEHIVVEGAEAFQKTRQFIKTLIPTHIKRVKEYAGNVVPLFYEYHVESQLETIMRPSVRLPSGGTIVIQPTEALVAIDVNSGQGLQGHNLALTALNTNLEAAQEIAHQIRLRDLSGLIVIDFIDIAEEEHAENIYKTFKAAFKDDKAKVSCSKINEFGLLTLSRQRLRSSLGESQMVNCPCCHGTGRVRSTESMALYLIRMMEIATLSEPLVRVHVAPQVAEYIYNNKREELIEIEKMHNARIFIISDPRLYASDYKIELPPQPEIKKAVTTYANP